MINLSPSPSPTTDPVSRNASPLKSAVGIVLKGCVVDFFLPGVPASRQMRKGDVILEIDGNPVDDSSASTALIGGDIPGVCV